MYSRELKYLMHFLPTRRLTRSEFFLMKRNFRGNLTEFIVKANDANVMWIIAGSFASYIGNCINEFEDIGM